MDLRVLLLINFIGMMFIITISISIIIAIVSTIYIHILCLFYGLRINNTLVNEIDLFL